MKKNIEKNFFFQICNLKKNTNEKNKNDCNHVWVEPRWLFEVSFLRKMKKKKFRVWPRQKPLQVKPCRSFKEKGRAHEAQCPTSSRRKWQDDQKIMNWRYLFYNYLLFDLIGRRREKMIWVVVSLLSTVASNMTWRGVERPTWRVTAVGVCSLEESFKKMKRERERKRKLKRKKNERKNGTFSFQKVFDFHFPVMSPCGAHGSPIEKKEFF